MLEGIFMQLFCQPYIIKYKVNIPIINLFYVQENKAILVTIDKTIKIFRKYFQCFFLLSVTLLGLENYFEYWIGTRTISRTRQNVKSAGHGKR